MISGNIRLNHFRHLQRALRFCRGSYRKCLTVFSALQGQSGTADEAVASVHRESYRRHRPRIGHGTTAGSSASIQKACPEVLSVSGTMA